ncbi:MULTISPECIES: YeiH family protein [Haloferax]|uniref:Putative sulfate exporter family transporter n=1 Tax=Haloferax marinum TaxID=2666143 RepID=A0A6A8G9D4_9EURY|nr:MULTISPECIES: putative sulfate exporter family transporter [Haloferax]KAB1198513.1 putative sulfate exporter family transporter [Haloferax sp. CBA1150]MRW97621.1 putative sulfate exporter family transporter [Haloferax marinum]
MVAGRIQRLLPGLGLLVVLAGVATLVAGVVPGVNALLLGVFFGAVVANTVGVPDWAKPGVDTQTVLLEAGIVLLGARIALDELVASGPLVIGLVVVTVVVSIALVEVVAGRGFGLTAKTSSLLAAGASVCGVSAATAIAGTIDADGESLAHVVATVLLFDAITLAVFPVAGEILPLTGQQFGVWAGLSMFSTGPVTAAGFAHSEVAGQWATVTKLARNSMLGAVALWYAARYASPDSGGVKAVVDGIPAFLVGFVLVAILANVGLFSTGTLAGIDTASDTLFALAFVGLGLDIRLDAMRETGVSPAFVLAVQLLAISTVSLAAVMLFI